MVLKYDIEGSWSNSIKVEDDKYIIGLFLANSSNTLKNKDTNNEEKTFEKYLRECEKQIMLIG